MGGTGEHATVSSDTSEGGLTPPTAVSIGALRRRARRGKTLGYGDRVGRYEILSSLGVGGMGVVYKAFDPELDRVVALKLLRVRTDDERVASSRARLLREAKALAQLAHPNVVAVHDVGAIDRDVFIAMEFVEGVTLKVWRKAQPRTPAEVFAVFRAAGAGLAAAHAAGLIHRDFKPDNVMIGQDGRVRVLDFGLARTAEVSLDTPDADVIDPTPDQIRVSSRLTQHGAIAGTPAYMAPEQHRNGDVDARADQFAFCVALYEALCDRRPFVGGNRAELRDAIVAGDPPPFPNRAGVSSRQRRAILRGLSRRAADRFPSMPALLAALAPPARGVIATIGVAAGAAAIAGAVAVVVTARAAEGPAPCRDPVDHFAGVWDDATRARMAVAFARTARPYAADAFARVAAELDRRTDAWNAMRGEVCVATRVRGEQSEALMDLRVQCLDRVVSATRGLTAVLSEQPVPEAVDQALAATLELPRVETCADAAALQAAAPLPDDAGKRAAIGRLRAALDGVVALEQTGHYDRGLREVAPVAAEAARIGWAPLDAQAQFWLAMLQSRVGDSETAAATLKHAMQLAAAAHDDALFVRAGVERVFVLGYELARPDAALDLAEVIDPLVTRAGEDPLLRGRLLDRIGVVRWAKGDYALAQQFFERALPLYVAAVGPDHPLVAALHTNLGNTFADAGRHGDARKEYEQELAILTRTVGARHPDVGRSLANLGTVLESQGQDAEAQALFERALALWEDAYGRDHAMVAMALTNLGELHNKHGDPARALPLCARARAIGDQLLPDDHPIRGYHLMCVARALVMLHRPAEAAPLLARTIAIRQAAGGPPADLADAQFELAQATWALGKPAEARALATAARGGRATDPAPHRERDAIDAWLAAHR